MTRLLRLFGALAVAVGLYQVSAIGAVVLTRTTSGLLYESDGSMTGWSGDTTQWTSDTSDPAFLTYPIARTFYTQSDAAEVQGVREPQIYIEGSTWWLLYDAGNGSTGWRQFLAHSTDRGVTWTRNGAFGMNLSKVVSGTWAATANGWFEKRGSTYILNRIPVGQVFNSGNSEDGLPFQDYYWDTWTNTIVSASGWAPSANTPTGNQRMDLSGAGAIDHLPNTTIKDGSTYRNFAELRESGGAYAGHFTIGISTASNPDGPYTAPSASILNSGTPGFGGRDPENTRIFYSSTLSRWAALLNMIAVDQTTTDANAIAYSTSLTDWSGVKASITQSIAPLDTTNHAVGLASHFTGPDGALIEGPNGRVPVVYDTDPRLTDQPVAYHLGRSIKGAVLEPAVASLHIRQSANINLYAIRRAQALTDGVIELGVEIVGQNTPNGMGFRVEYRGDATGANCYIFAFGDGGAQLEKVVSGSTSILTTHYTGLVWRDHFIHRVKIVVTGNVHKAYFDGELQWTYTDSSSPFASGTYIGLSDQGGDLDVRHLTVRTSDVLTVTGLEPGATVWLRGFGSLPVESSTANGSGVATFTEPHWPHYAIDTDGTTDHSVSDAPTDTLWGGDVVELNTIGHLLTGASKVILSASGKVLTR